MNNRGKNATAVKVGAAMTAVALVAAACGSSQSAPRPDPLHIVQTAYTDTIGSKSAKVTIAESVDSSSTGGSNESATVTGTGSVDFSTQAFDITVNAPSGGTEEVLETGGTEYIQVPVSERSQVPGGKAWESVDLNQVDEAKVGRSFAQLSSVNSDSPTQALSNLAGVSDQVTSLGAATVGGVSTTHYRATVDLTKEAAEVTAKEGAKAGAQITQEEQSLGTATIPVEIWVDTSGLVRQLREQIPIPSTGSGTSTGSGSATVTLGFSGFGTQPAPVPPPPSDTADITQQVIQQASATS